MEKLIGLLFVSEEYHDTPYILTFDRKFFRIFHERKISFALESRQYKLMKSEGMLVKFQEKPSKTARNRFLWAHKVEEVK